MLQSETFASYINFAMDFYLHHKFHDKPELNQYLEKCTFANCQLKSTHDH